MFDQKKYLVSVWSIVLMLPFILSHALTYFLLSIGMYESFYSNEWLIKLPAFIAFCFAPSYLILWFALDKNKGLRHIILFSVFLFALVPLAVIGVIVVNCAYLLIC